MYFAQKGKMGKWLLQISVNSSDAEDGIFPLLGVNKVARESAGMVLAV